MSPIFQVSKHRGPTYTFDELIYNWSTRLQAFWVVQSFFLSWQSAFLDKQLSQFVSRWVYAWNLEAMSAETCDSSNDLTWVSCGFLHEECAHVYQQRTAEVFVDTLFLAGFSAWGTMPVFWIGHKNRILRLESIDSWTASSRRSSSGGLNLWQWMDWPPPLKGHASLLGSLMRIVLVC